MDKVGAHRQLVGEAQRDRQIDEEVHEVPALVGEPPARARTDTTAMSTKRAAPT